ncbi:hypothetical protein B0T13DRAFT_523020 [Neurospora crassa]|nr:hypothetical protein B0T13DRAFT_523020 [Neurospora crassa]
MELIYRPYSISSRGFSLISLTLLLFSSVFGQEQQYLNAPPANRFLRRMTARATVLGNYIKATPKTGPLALADQAIWNDPSGDAFYIFGGRTTYMINMDKITKDGIWRFTVDGTGGGTWTLERPSDPDVLKKLNLTDKAAFTATRSPSGGGMVSYDMKSRTFSRTDTSAVMPPLGTLVDGRAQFVPQFGSDGLMLVLGGRIGGGTLDFNNITFYNLKSGQWGWQKTVGYAPTDRGSFCMVGVASPAGTYELFIYGGTGQGGDYDDIYILSLPGFVWLKTDARSVELRNNHACVVVGKRQMLVVGGLGKNWSFWDQDPFPQGLGIFDLTDLAWSKDGKYDANAEDYRTPTLVEEWYQDKNLSALSWSSDEVKRMFLKNPVSFSATTSRPASTSIASSATGPDSGQQSSVSKAGPIAGGVVGGAIILCILSGLAYHLRRKRSKPSPSDGDLQPGQSSDNALKHSPSLKSKGELPTEGPAMEMYTPPDELACGGGINERWELDASSPPRELDTSHGACELGTENREVTR